MTDEIKLQMAGNDQWQIITDTIWNTKEDGKWSIMKDSIYWNTADNDK